MFLRGDVLRAKITAFMFATYSCSRSTIVLTFAESKRKLALENDPRATDITPTSVRCNMCAAEIKLSPKSAYDNFHWKTHKERCMKKSKNPAARGPGGMYSLKRPGRKPDIISPHSARPIKTVSARRILLVEQAFSIALNFSFIQNLLTRVSFSSIETVCPRSKTSEWDRGVFPSCLGSERQAVATRNAR